MNPILIVLGEVSDCSMSDYEHRHPSYREVHTLSSSSEPSTSTPSVPWDDPIFT